MKKNLSEILNWWEYNSEEIVNYCLDNGIDTIVNNTVSKPHVEYAIEDLQQIWDNISIEYFLIEWPEHLLN